jgi:hypothetical protein
LTFDTCLAQNIRVAELSEQAALAELQTRLSGIYTGATPDQISAAIQNAHAHFEQSPIRDFIPLLVERRARQQLG